MLCLFLGVRVGDSLDVIVLSVEDRMVEVAFCKGSREPISTAADVRKLSASLPRWACGIRDRPGTGCLEVFTTYAVVRRMTELEYQRNLADDSRGTTIPRVLYKMSPPATIRSHLKLDMMHDLCDL